MSAPESPAWSIVAAESAADIARCFSVMRELRPAFTEEAVFVAQVQRQQAEGFCLAYLETGGAVRAVAGYRIMEMLHAGRTLYVDDLVCAAAHRSKGYGGRLLDWLVDRAREAGCAAFSLDSGVQRFDAHRFYLRKGMHIVSHHFSMPLEALRREAED